MTDDAAWRWHDEAAWRTGRLGAEMIEWTGNEKHPNRRIVSVQKMSDGCDEVLRHRQR